MNRRLTVTLTALMLAAGMAGMSGAGASSGGNLTGDWSSPLPSELGGTSLALTQSGSTITWQGGPNDRSWVQKFTGELSGDTISGSFEQDVPGRTPARYHGTITARVIDSCHFKTILVRQPGVPDTGGAMFTKSPCAKTAISGSWQVRAHQTLKGTAVGMVGAGQFVGDANGQIVS